MDGKRLWRAVVYGAVLLPLGLAAVGVTLAGRETLAVRWWRRLAGRATVPARDPGRAAIAGHAVASVLLGVVALVPLGVMVLSVLRGLLYGFVDRGPYDDAWGGPTKAGAWVAHLLIGLPLAAAGLLLLTGVVALHRRLGRRLHGERPGWWVVPLTLLLSGFAALLIVGWTRQI